MAPPDRDGAPPAVSGARGDSPGAGEAAALRDDLDRARREWVTLSAAVAHALRTPLSAIAGEVELALHRERHAAEYRAALARIGDRVAELDELTTDLAAFGPDDAAAAATVVTVGEVLAGLRPQVAVAFGGTGSTTDLRVFGDLQRLVRALTLLVRHAARHRNADGPVSVRLDRVDDRAVDLVIDASPPRFPGHTWLHLAGPGGHGDRVNTSGLFQVRTAAHLIEQCGGGLTVDGPADSDAVRVRLRRAPAGSD